MHNGFPPHHPVTKLSTIMRYYNILNLHTVEYSRYYIRHTQYYIYICTFLVQYMGVVLLEGRISTRQAHGAARQHQP